MTNIFELVDQKLKENIQEIKRWQKLAGIIK